MNELNTSRSVFSHYRHHRQSLFSLCSRQRYLAAAVGSVVTYVGFNIIVDKKFDRRSSLNTVRYPVREHDVCRCEWSHDKKLDSVTTNSTNNTLKPLSRLTLIAYASRLYPHSYLPVPRILTPRDPIFSYPDLRRGIKLRLRDEKKIKDILSSYELTEARKKQDPKQMEQILHKINAVVHGDSISPKTREDFLIQYGCTGYTEEVIQYLFQNFSSRGIIEIGAGNGQWARALNDAYNRQTHKNCNIVIPNVTGTSVLKDFVLAFDNMQQLPLSPIIYHKSTLPANKFFYNKVHQLTHVEAVRQSHGRVLLLVYPPPGSMAIETVRAYIDASCRHHGSLQNDTIVYVGEGRGGANADDEFFDFFLSTAMIAKTEEEQKDGWVIEKIMDVCPSPGGKGYEKLFVLRRIKTVH